MICTEREEQISALIDGELADPQASSLFTHLGQCAGCRRFLRNTLLLRERLTAGGVEKAESDSINNRHYSAQAKATRIVGRRSRPISLRRPIAIAAAILLFALGGSTASLLLNTADGDQVSRIIYVVALPTIEVESTYLPQEL
jgi:anti-sigma factor RsiW